MIDKKLAGMITAILTGVLLTTGCIGVDLGDDLSTFGVEQVTYELVNGTITIEDDLTDIISIVMSNETFDDLLNITENVNNLDWDTDNTNDRLDITEVTITATNETITVEVNFVDMDLDSNASEFLLDINMGLNQNISATEEDEDIETITIIGQDTNETTTIDWESEIENETDTYNINATIGTNKLTYVIPLEYFNGTEYNSSEEVETVSIVITSSLTMGDEEDAEITIQMDVFPTPLEEDSTPTSVTDIIAFLTSPWILFSIATIVVIVAIVTFSTKKKKEYPTCPPGTFLDEHGECKELGE